MPLTRSSTECPILGAVMSDFSSTKLPSNGDVLRLYRFTRFFLRPWSKSETQLEAAQEDIVSVIFNKLKQKWVDDASIPENSLISDYAIKRQIKRVYDHEGHCRTKSKRNTWNSNKCYKEMDRVYDDHKRRGTLEGNTYQEQKDKYLAYCDKLFDISACKKGVGCQCNCCQSMHEEDLLFLIDQRSERLRDIGPSIDVQGSKELFSKQVALQKRNDRKERDEEARCSQQENWQLQSSSQFETVGFNSDDEIDTAMGIDMSDDDYIPEREVSRPGVKLEHFLYAVFEVGLSSENAARIGNGFLKDLAPFLSRKLLGWTLTLSKIRDDKDKFREQVMTNHVATLRKQP